MGEPNCLKQRTLRLFAKHGPMTPQAFAVIARMPRSGSYTYLQRLAGYALLAREHKARGLLIYRITDRGRERLRWLDRQMATDGGAMRN